MSGRLISSQLKVPVQTVYRILKQEGLSRLKHLEPRQPAVRYERQRPGDLLHIDVKKLGRIARPGHRVNGDRTTRVRGVGWECVHVCIDDSTRLAYVEVLADETGPSCAGFLRRALAWYRRQGIRVERVMTDNGSAYRSDRGIFHSLLAAQGIRHLRTRPYRPQTNGKAERFIQTVLREWAYARSYRSSRRRTELLRPWLLFYNSERPHGSLGGRSPRASLRLKGEQRA